MFKIKFLPVFLKTAPLCYGKKTRTMLKWDVQAYGVLKRFLRSTANPAS